jgi:hypothetical protein
VYMYVIVCYIFMSNDKISDKIENDRTMMAIVVIASSSVVVVVVVVVQFNSIQFI